MRRIAAAVAVAVGLLSALGGTAAANGGSGSATACTATSSKTVDPRFLVTLTKGDVDPSEVEFATCSYARKVAGRVTAMELKTARVVDGFSCTVLVLKRKPGIWVYHCVFEGADTTTEVALSFRAVYLSEAIRGSVDRLR